MGYIKEPKGVDFIIESVTLTEEEKKEISQFIREYKSTQGNKTKKVVKKKKKELS
jgi:hypothetical protein